MDRKGGIAAAAVLIAILGVSFVPRRSGETAPSSTAGEAKRNTRQTVAHTQAAQVKAACEEISDRIGRFFVDPQGHPQEIPFPGSCYNPNRTISSSLQTPNNLQFAIALAPNPAQTNLPLVFDRMIEAVQQAAQDEGYSYDGSWFPWTDERSYDTFDDEQKAEAWRSELQKQPGVIAFRRIPTEAAYSGGLIVFVVGEQPTGGISDEQFENAMLWLGNLGAGPDKRALSILGPTFSGSLPSLARELKNTQVFAPGSRGARVHSGTANSYSSFKWFQDRLPKTTAACSSDCFIFRTFLESDQLMTDRFLEFLEKSGFELSRVAILSEDETAFGSLSTDRTARSSRKGKCSDIKDDSDKSNCLESQPAYLYYPRDIATLRSAYSKQSIFSAGKAGGNAPSTSLHGDLGDAATSKHDTTRSYAGDLTPSAQEATLFSIVNVLQAKRARFVVIRSTNSLDQLFLAEFLRRAYPDARIVLDGADQLFRRGVEGEVMRGVMVLSAYPLLDWTQDQIRPMVSENGGYRLADGTPKQSSHRVFSEDISEGTYIAARALFPPANRDAPPVPDYGVPLWILSEKDTAEDRMPPTWLSVVGHRQFWPVAILNCYTLNNDRASPCTSGSAALVLPAALPDGSARGQTNDTYAGKNRSFPPDTTALVLFCWALGLWHLYLCWTGRIIGFPRVRAYFAPVPIAEQPTLIFIGGLFLAALGVALAGTTGLMEGFYTGHESVLLWTAVVCMVGCGLLGFLANYMRPLLAAKPRPSVVPVRFTWRHLSDLLAARKIPAWVLGVLWIVLLSCLVAIRLHLNGRLGLATRLSAFWRNSHISNGVSGLLPQVLLILGMYAWFWCNLRGLALFGEDRPLLPDEASLPELFLNQNSEPVLESLDDRAERSLDTTKHGARLFSMFSSEGAARQIENAAMPLSCSYVGYFLGILATTILLCGLTLDGPYLQTLGDRAFGTLIFFAMCIAIAAILSDTFRLAGTWARLRQLLVFLDRLRLRRTLAHFKGLSWTSVLSMSGNVLEERYRLISRQLESTRNLHTTLAAWDAKGDDIAHREAAQRELTRCENAGLQFALHYAAALSSPTDAIIANLKRDLATYQEVMAQAAGHILTCILLPAWRGEGESMIVQMESSGSAEDKESRPPLSANSHVRAAEEFFVLPYLGFIQNVLGAMRSVAVGILLLFTAMTLALSSYPFNPRPALGAICLVLFVIVGATVVFVYGEMHRDATLSHLTQTRPGELGFEFWTKIVSFGIGPLIGLLTTLFPSITDFVVSWLQPGAETMK